MTYDHIRQALESAARAFPRGFAASIADAWKLTHAGSDQLGMMGQLTATLQRSAWVRSMVDLGQVFAPPGLEAAQQIQRLQDSARFLQGSRCLTGVAQVQDMFKGAQPLRSLILEISQTLDHLSTVGSIQSIAVGLETALRALPALPTTHEYIAAGAEFDGLGDAPPDLAGPTPGESFAQYLERIIAEIRKVPDSIGQRLLWCVVAVLMHILLSRMQSGLDTAVRDGSRNTYIDNRAINNIIQEYRVATPMRCMAVIAQELDVRARPYRNSSRVAVLRQGAAVVIVRNLRPWARILRIDPETGSSIQGWVLVRYLVRVR